MPLSKGNRLDGGMTEEELYVLPTFRYKPLRIDQGVVEEIAGLDKSGGDEVDGRKCAMCQYEFKADDHLRTLRCNHIYHKGCIDPWLLHHANCP